MLLDNDSHSSPTSSSIPRVRALEEWQAEPVFQAVKGNVFVNMGAIKRGPSRLANGFRSAYRELTRVRCAKDDNRGAGRLLAPCPPCDLFGRVPRRLCPLGMTPDHRAKL